jgi:hypothetical protein
VLAGYYFGAGLMVKPSVVEGVRRATAQLAGRCGRWKRGQGVVAELGVWGAVYLQLKQDAWDEVLWGY